MVGANLLTSLILAQIIQYLWGIINSLQLVVLTVLFSMPAMPKKCEELLVQILSYINLDVMPTDSVLVAMFGFRETQSFNETLL